MAIMQSCCCWRSVRRGSFACAIYTVIYFVLLAVTTGTILKAESQYLTGNRSLPESSSLLEPETISPTTVGFNVMLLICSCCGLLCCSLLLYGLFTDQRTFLIPWIITVTTCGAIDIVHSLYLLTVTPNFTPISAMVYTLNFFLLSLNVYSVLCVVSQYQEYLAGRGTAADDYDNRVPVVRYTTQPTTTATSCLSSRRTVTNETKATATPTQSPTAGQTGLSSEKCPGGVRQSRKHVQFPDTSPTYTKEDPGIPPMDSKTKWTQEIDVARSTSSNQLPIDIVTIITNQSIQRVNSDTAQRT